MVSGIATIRPRILLDKSTLQSLGWHELIVLHKYYHVVHAPVLILETFCNLGKFPEGEREKKTQNLARKFLSGNSSVPVHRHDLFENSLLGYEPRITLYERTPPRPGDRLVRSEDDKLGKLTTESLEHRALLRWKTGDFSDGEMLIAGPLRESIRSFDLEKTKKGLPAIWKSIGGIDGLADASRLITKILDSPSVQNDLLFWLLDQNISDLEKCSDIFHRWESGEWSLLSDMSSYAHFCGRTRLLFLFGLARGFVGTKSTNRVDLEYLYYLPFCTVFSSGDKMHAELAPLLLEMDQHFVSRDRLKTDLASIVEKRTIQSDPQHKMDLAPAPPFDPHSFTSKLYGHPGKGRLEIPPRSKEIPDDLKPDLERFSKAVIEELEKLRKNSKTTDEGLFESPSPEFTITESTLLHTDPCRCGSGMSYEACRACH